MTPYIEVSGAGEDLALLHGWGMHGGIWNGVRDALARRFRVHCVDLPGYGASPSCRPYDLKHLATIMAESLPSRVNVLGWSLGGLLAQRWALDHPRQVARLMLVGATPCFVQRPDWPHGIEATVLEAFGCELERDFAATLLRFLSLQTRGGDEARAVLKTLRATLFARGEPSTEVLAAGLRLLLESDLRGEIGHLAPPLHILHGERDMLAPADAARWLHQQVPGAQLTLIDGCAHAPFLSHPDAFLRAVTEFFQ